VRKAYETKRIENYVGQRANLHYTELPRIPRGLSLEKLVRVGNNEIDPSKVNKKYLRAIEILKKWCDGDLFSGGIRGFSEAVIEKIGREFVNQVLKDLEEKGLGLSPMLLREAFKARGVEINLGFAELLYKCIKHVGISIDIRAVVLPAVSDESKVLALVKAKGSVKFLEIYKKVENPEITVLNLVKKGLVEVHYRRKQLKLDKIDKFEGLSEEEIREIPDVFLAKVKMFDGSFSYRVAIPSSARVSLKWI
jgi:hypothetical protein